MIVSVAIHPSSRTLCMINDPDASTAYSLSGHVSICLSSDSSAPPHTEKLLLRSLTLVFEGQAELITHETGYSGVRLCRLTRELAPVHPMLLSNGGHEDAETPAAWTFVFDLPIPGWLPASSVYGSVMGGQTGTSYGLYAEARFTPLEDGQHARSWSLSSLCAPFAPRVRSVNAPRKEIEVVRYMTPRTPDGTTASATFPNIQFGIKARNDVDRKRTDAADIFKKIEVRALVAEHVDMDARSFVLALRMRTKGLSTEQEQRLRLAQFRLSLSQHEVYSRIPFRSYVSTYPLPSSQPDSEPLLHTHALKGLFDMSLVSYNFLEGLGCRIRSSFPLLGEKQLGRHDLPCGGILLQTDRELAQEQSWTRMDVCVPFEYALPGDDEDWEEQNDRVKALRPDVQSPFLRVHHELEVELSFTYDAENSGEKPFTERIAFSLPVKFARTPPVESQDSLELPAYSQLYHSNGERRVDNMAPLPAYSPCEDSEAGDSSSKS